MDPILGPNRGISRKWLCTELHISLFIRVFGVNMEQYTSFGRGRWHTLYLGVWQGSRGAPYGVVQGGALAEVPMSPLWGVWEAPGHTTPSGMGVYPSI